MKKCFLSMIATAVLLFVAYVPSASATPAALGYSITFVDTTFDQASTDGFDDGKDWYQWLYKVEVIEGDSSSGLSHFTLELQDCFTPELLAEIETTMGENGNPPNGTNIVDSNLVGNALRSYDHETGVDNGGDPSLYGLKWDITSGSFETIGDYDYFWFSAPTDQGVFTNDALVKHGQNNTLSEGLFTPDCPDCDPDIPPPVIPEPATMLLLGFGLSGGAFMRRKKK